MSSSKQNRSQNQNRSHTPTDTSHGPRSRRPVDPTGDIEGPGSGVTGVTLIASFVLFLGGLYLMGTAAEMHGVEALMFFCGILAATLAFVIPTTVLMRPEQH
jgi:hypothetical protein